MITRMKSIIPTPIKAILGKAFDCTRFAFWSIAHKNPRIKRPVFFLGVPRSGTTIAVRLFATHSYVANWSEAGQIWDPYSYYDPDADHHWDENKATADETKRLHRLFAYYCWKNGKDRFVNKHPRNSVRIDFLRKMFPDALYIHVVRDGRAVVNSMLKVYEKDPKRYDIPFGQFCKPPDWKNHLDDNLVRQSAIQWNEIVKFILSKKAELGNKYFEFKYEELCENPRGILKQVFDFADLPSSDDF